ncbi:MAG: VWA domain-containing protein [Candidatus Babeliaceae bacterium]
MIFRFANSWVLWYGLPLLLFIIWWRWKYYKPAIYKFPLTGYLKKTVAHSLNSSFFTRLFSLNRFLILFLLLLITARPQLGEMSTPVPVQGIAIMLVLDVSDSMLLMDDMKTQQSRFSIALEQAKQFIDKRIADEIGLIFFAQVAVSRCPLTLDKQLLKKVLQDTTMGIIDSSGTKLSTAIALAAQRLKASKAASKIMIVLTDGMPTDNDLSPERALDLVRAHGIKVYTIGIGGADAYYKHPLVGIMQCQTEYNQQLLLRFAQESGGQFFEASKAAELYRIYDSIDQLEKTDDQVPWYTAYYELFMYLLVPMLLLFVGEMLFKIRGWGVL